MGTIRREAVADLTRIEADAKTLRMSIEFQMDDTLAAHDLATYEDIARHLRHSLDHLDEQLKRLKDII